MGRCLEAGAVQIKCFGDVHVSYYMLYIIFNGCVSGNLYIKQTN